MIARRALALLAVAGVLAACAVLPIEVESGDALMVLGKEFGAVAQRMERLRTAGSVDDAEWARWVTFVSHFQAAFRGAAEVWSAAISNEDYRGVLDQTLQMKTDLLLWKLRIQKGGKP